MKLPKPTYDMPIDMPIGTPLWLESSHEAIRKRRMRALKRQKWLAILLALVALLSTAQFVIWAIRELR